MTKLVKVKYADMMTRLKLPTGLNGTRPIPLHELKSKIFYLFKLNGVAEELILRYKDADGDVISILDNECLVDALRNYWTVDPFYMEAWLSRSELGSCPKCSECRFDKMGPFGGGGGINWNDGKFEGINGITVTTSEESLQLLSIQVSYATEKGRTHTGARHGGAGKAITTKFNYPNEKIQEMTVYSGLVAGGSWTVIKGLLFETNLAKYGPFGVADCTTSQHLMKSNDIVGVYGRACDKYLDSIGLYVKSVGGGE